MKSHRIHHEHGPISSSSDKYFGGLIGKLECYIPCSATQHGHADDEDGDSDAPSFLAPLVDVKCSWYRRTYEFKRNEMILKPLTEIIIRTNGSAVLWGDTFDGGNMSLTMEICDAYCKGGARVGSKMQKIDHQGSSTTGERLVYVRLNYRSIPRHEKRRLCLRS